MKVYMHDGPCRYVVESESEGDKSSYLVDLCQYERSPGIFNGTCQCSDFVYRHEPKLKRPENNGKIMRCKHIRCARDLALDIIIAHLAKNDRNLQDDQLP